MHEMTKPAADKATLKRFACASAILLGADVVVFRLLLPNRIWLADYPIPTIDASIADWLSLIAWPAFAVAGITLWLLPHMKQRPREDWTRARVSLWLLFFGCLIEGLARTLLNMPVIGNGVAMLGSVMQLGGTMLYVAAIWAGISRSLHPAARDVLLQMGAVWFLVSVGLHFAYNMSLALEYTASAYLRSVDALYAGFALGFIGNTGLWLLTSVMPQFLNTREPRPRVISGVLTYNVVLLLWVLGEAWALQYPYTWVRLPLALAGLGTAGVTIYLLTDLSAFRYLGAQVTAPRRVLAKVTAGAAVVGMVASVAIVAAIGVWLGSTSDVWVPNISHALQEVLRVGVGTFLLMAMFISFLGPRAGTGARGGVLWLAIVLVTGGLVTQAGVNLLVPLTALDLAHIQNVAGGVLAAGHLLVVMWLLVSAPTA